MKAFKKILALSLAMTMSLSVLVSAASFSDAESIDTVEAVNTLVSLGIVNGRADGSFGPKDLITRAEMAKMIFTLRNGGNSDASFYANMANPFTDMGGSEWAKGYVNYCYSLGIIAGKGSGKFDPKAPVTGLEAAKMLLVTAGYQADKAKLVGKGWDLNAASLAATEGLYEGFAADVTKGTPREYAAQLLSNALDLEMVKYSKDTESFVKETPDNSAAVTLGTKHLGLKYVTGTLIGVGEYGAGKAGQIKIQTYKDDGTSGSTYTATFKTDLTCIGEEVKVMYKDGKNSSNAILDVNDDVYGFNPTGKTTVYNITKSDVEAATKIGKIKFSGKEYDVAKVAGKGYKLNVVSNFTGANDVYSCNTSSASTKLDSDKGSLADFETLVKKDSPDVIKFIANDDGKIMSAYIITKAYGKVTNITSDKITIEGVGASVDRKNVLAYEDIAKGDIVVYNKLFYTTSEDATYKVVKADIVEGSVEAVKNSSEIRIDGKWYKHAVSNAARVADFDSDVPDVGDKVKAIVDGGCWIAKNAIEESSKEYAVVIGASNGIDQQVKAVLADGTTKVFKLHKDTQMDSAVVKFNEQVKEAAPALVQYTLSDGGKTMKVVKCVMTKDASGTDGASVYDKDTKKFDGTLTSSDAVGFVNKTESKYAAQKADTLGNVTVATSGTRSKIASISDSGKVAAFVVVAAKSASTSGNDYYGMVISDRETYKDSNDDKYTQFKVWNGTEEVTVKVDDGSYAKTVKGDFVKYVQSEGYIASSDITNLGKVDSKADAAAVVDLGKVTDYDSNRGIVTVSSGATLGADGKFYGGTVGDYYLKNDSKIVGVNSIDAKGVEIDKSSIVKANTTIGEDYNNVFVIYDSKDNNKVLSIFVDVNNEMCPGKHTSGENHGQSVKGLIGEAGAVTVSVVGGGDVKSIKRISGTGSVSSTTTIAGASRGDIYEVTVTGATAGYKITASEGNILDGAVTVPSAGESGTSVTFKVVVGDATLEFKAAS